MRGYASCFIGAADKDIITSAGCRYLGGLEHALYHGCQALEKYFKALWLLHLAPAGSTDAVLRDRTFRTHLLHKWAERCAEKFPHYGDPALLAQLARLSELDRYTRYPEERRAGNDQSMSTGELKPIEELILRIRDDLGIDLFHFPLHGLLYHAQGRYPGFEELGSYAADHRNKFAVQTFYPRLYQSLLELPMKAPSASS